MRYRNGQRELFLLFTSDDDFSFPVSLRYFRYLKGGHDVNLGRHLCVGEFQLQWLRDEWEKEEEEETMDWSEYSASMTSKKRSEDDGLHRRGRLKEIYRYFLICRGASSAT